MIYIEIFILLSLIYGWVVHREDQKMRKLLTKEEYLASFAADPAGEDVT